ncbi:tripartite tricarboxylate transporter TctB family protein [Treponema parvum]|uniref:Tripartite tricarboxylate transporter TctB family protein n=1 Tax=Treponema parvum TaxID=138851 RepID=A0A975F5Q8_9SPIR|nr:tripartite tricarboxylate transporter TctB family protein [Treponema parvum]QTQ14966.1 tripartite tricarboxylate transporter TctB family protein [Treponema parvum]QTQ17178.1 tripartite tricarboxylate transporter TctB family protein [Treponema parvum]
MTNKTKSGLGVGLFFFILAVFYFIGSVSIESYNPFGKTGLSSRAVPQTFAILMAVLSLTIIVDSILKAKKEKGSSAEKAKVNRKTTGKLLLAIFLLLVYIFLFNRLGFIISTILYLFAMIYLLLPNKTSRNIVLTALFSIAVSFLIYTIFNKALGLILPAGIFGY